MPKFDNCKNLGHPIFQGRPQYSLTATINMYLVIELSHNNLIQCHGFYFDEKVFNYMLEIDTLGNSSQTFLGVRRGGI